MIEGKPCGIYRFTNFDNETFNKQFQISLTSEADGLYLNNNQFFIIETVGVDANLQHDQNVYIALVGVIDGKSFTFPILLSGELIQNDPNFPVRRFGNQSLLIYANQRIDIIMSCNSNSGNAQINVNINGRIVDC